MAHFARLDEDNVVQEVVVIANDDCLDENGAESEAIGIAFCEQLFNRIGWIQTSYNNNFRGQFAGVGYSYIPERDIFVRPKSKPWHVLDGAGKWVCPIGTHPDTGEELKDWQWEYLEMMESVKINWNYPIQLMEDRGLQ
jgi:hypothetical protein